VVVPNDIEVPAGPGRYHVASLTALDIPTLQDLFATLRAGQSPV